MNWNRMKVVSLIIIGLLLIPLIMFLSGRHTTIQGELDEDGNFVIIHGVDAEVLEVHDDFILAHGL